MSTVASDLSWNLNGNDQLSGVLERLDRTLTRLGRHIDDTTGDARAMGRALGETAQSASRADRAMDRLKNAADNARGRFAALRSGIMQLGAASVIAMGIATGAVAKFALETAAANETAQISFEVLLGSATKALHFLDELKAFAAATPFELPELRSAASRLLAVGVETKKIIPLLTRLGDATAAMGTGSFGIERAVYALQQMSQAGKVSLEDINQLTDAGIPALDALSAKLGITVSKLREQISAGKIKPEQLFDAILTGAGKTFPKLNGMMARQSTTLAGLWSSFKDNAGQSLAKFAEPAIPGIKKVLDFLSTEGPKALSWIQEQGGKAVGWFDKNPIKPELINALKTLNKLVGKEAKEAWKDLTTWVKANEDKFERIGRWIAEVGIPNFGDLLVGAIHATVEAIKLGVNIADAFVSAWDWMTRRCLEFTGNMLASAVKAFGWIPGLGPKLKKAQEDFDKFSRGVINTLNKIDGKTVRVTILGNVKVKGGTQLSGDQADYRRAAGGPVWRGQSYDVGEMGVERYYAAQTGFIKDAASTRAENARGGGGEVLGQIEVVVRGESGEVIQTKLLALKRRRKLRTLGFEAGAVAA